MKYQIILRKDNSDEMFVYGYCNGDHEMAESWAGRALEQLKDKGYTSWQVVCVDELDIQDLFAAE